MGREGRRRRRGVGSKRSPVGLSLICLLRCTEGLKGTGRCRTPTYTEYNWALFSPTPQGELLLCSDYPQGAFGRNSQGACSPSAEGEQRERERERDGERERERDGERERERESKERERGREGEGERWGEGERERESKEREGEQREREREVNPGVFLSVALFLVYVWSSEISSAQLRLGDIRPPCGQDQGLGLGGFVDVVGQRSRCMCLLWGARHLLIEHDRGPEVLIVCHWSQILETWVFFMVWFLDLFHILSDCIVLWYCV